MEIIDGGGCPTGNPRRSYQCTVCGKIGFWEKGWSYYGSKSGKWAIPKLRFGPGGGMVMRGKGKKGY